MENLQSLAAMLLNRWSMSLAGAAMAATLVWYLGPLVPGLEEELPRALAILVIAVLWLGLNGAVTWRRRRREQALATGVAAESPDGQDVAEEGVLLRERVAEAVKQLRAGGRRGYLYEQPWYLLIGPPGAGKTTALRNAGLRFPLAMPDGSDAAVAGVGGTRSCDWWFADEAVLIDTAGRYTTQDSDAAVDRAGWEGFLDLLRRTRPRQPVNGLIVVVSVAGIAAASPEERAAHARAVRRRVKEVDERLRRRVPVYAVFSKADQLGGFNEFFDDLDGEGRGQVWGTTLPLGAGVERFPEEFRLLAERLEERLIERLQGERALDRRAALAGFPLQVASLEAPLTEFLNLAFGGTKLDPAPFLRGIYLTSATQEGTPIDRVAGMLARSFGVDQRKVASLRPVSGRGFFLERLVREVILGEALLVNARSRATRVHRMLRVGGFAAVGVTAVAALLVIWRADGASRLAVERAAAATAAYGQQLAQARLDPVADDDLPRIVPLLDAARALPPGDAGTLADALGLGQGAKVAEAGRAIYRRELDRVLLPRLIWRLEQQMRDRIDDPDFLYEATRVYLMLGGAGPLDPGLVRGWWALDWQARFPGSLNAAVRERVLAHLDALLAEPLPALQLDGALVERARAAFSRVPLAARVYGRIRPEAAAAPDWSPATALGPAGAALFVRASGRPLTEGIPSFFTAGGFRDALLAKLPAATREVADESWVLGRREQVPTDGPAVASLEREVVSLYSAEFAARWDDLLADLAIAPFPDRAAAVQGLYVLSSPQSPLRDLLASIARELAVAPPPPAADGGNDATRLAAVVGGSGPAEPPAWAGIEEHYRALRTFVGDGGTAPVTDVLRLVNALQQKLAQVGGAPAAAADGDDPAQLLLAEARRQPPPVGRWLEQIAALGNTMLGQGAADATAGAFAAADGPEALCRTVVTARYPFDAASARDAPLDDFARLFAPGGLLDSFFADHLRSYVDTSGRVWRLRPAGGVAPPVSEATLGRFQQAARIRDAFFPTGGNQPTIRFTVQPTAAVTDEATLSLGGTAVTADGSDGRPAAFTWPGADGMMTASVAFGGDQPVAADGSWALFRLLDRASVAPAPDAEGFTLTFDDGERRASFELRPASSRNPFGSDLLQGFRCPVLRP